MIVSRRKFIETAAAASAVTMIPHESPADTIGRADLTQFVNIAIGTGGFGHTFPAATVPFGAVQLGPDTGDYDWNHRSGYHYDDETILGFSHTHLSGTGVGDMLDFRVMPGYVPKAGEPVTPASFASQFSHVRRAHRAWLLFRGSSQSLYPS